MSAKLYKILLLIVAIAVCCVLPKVSLAADKGKLVLKVEGFGSEFRADNEGRIALTKVNGKAGVGASEEQAKANLAPIQIGKAPSGETILFFEQHPPYWGRRVFYLDATSGVNLHSVMTPLFRLADLESNLSKGDKTAQKEITDLLSHKSALVRRETADVLARVAQRGMLPQVKAAWENEKNSEVKTAIEKVLKKLQE